MAKNTGSKTTTKTKKEIQGKAVGRNIILVIDGQKFSKAFKEKAHREAILAKVEAYNNRNSIAKEKEIIKIMLEGKLTITEKKQRVAKKAEKKAPAKKPRAKAEKKVSATTVADAKKMLEAEGYVVTKKRAAGHTGRRRER